MIWGVPLFSEKPIYIYIYICLHEWRFVGLWVFMESNFFQSHGSYGFEDLGQAAWINFAAKKQDVGKAFSRSTPFLFGVILKHLKINMFDVHCMWGCTPYFDACALHANGMCSTEVSKQNKTDGSQIPPMPPMYRDPKLLTFLTLRIT